MSAGRRLVGGVLGLGALESTLAPLFLRTFQWRLNDCFRQQRFPELKFTSEASIALTTFLARNANGAKFNAPAIKR